MDTLDLHAITRNYGKVHLKTEGASGSGNPSDPALYLSVSKDSISVKDTLLVNINLGTATNPVSNVYGLCFTIAYNPINVSKAKGIMADFSKCWLGTPVKNLIYLIHNFASD